jgi:DNA polymerase-3 subunit delta'
MVTTAAQPAPSHRPQALDMPWLRPALQKALHELQAHALLLSLPPGAGAFELALAIAQGWLCQNPQDGFPCGQCRSCHWFAVRSHPDFLGLLPQALEASLGSQNPETSSAEEKSTQAKSSHEIKVDAVRSAVSFVQTTSSSGRIKVILIHPAERMNLVASNALLKTLEEPAGVARFILSCSAPQALLPTVRSRCQVLPEPWPNTEQATTWLAQHSIQQPEVLLAAAGGLPLAARDWAAEGLTAEAWLDIPRCAIKGEPAALAAWPISRWVDALQKLCHDTLCVAVQGAPRFFPPAVVPRGASLKALASWGRQLHELARHADHPWSQPLALVALLQQARQALARS